MKFPFPENWRLTQAVHRLEDSIITVSGPAGTIRRSSVQVEVLPSMQRLDWTSLEEVRDG